MTINATIESQYIDWTADLSRLDAQMRRRAAEFVQELAQELVDKYAGRFAELTPFQRQKFAGLARSLEKFINQNYAEFGLKHLAELSEIAKLETAVLGNALNSSLQVNLFTTSLPAAKIKAIVDGTLIQGAPSSEWWSLQSRGLRESFTREMRMGIGSGESVQQMARRIRGKHTGRFRVINGKRYGVFAGGIMDATTRQAEALVRSSALAVNNAASQAIFTENSDIIKGLRTLATLDLRTTPLCRLRDGWAWDMKGNPIPSSGARGHFPGPPPWHWNCRTRLVPITRSFSDLAKKNRTLAKKLDRAMPESTRASMDGQVPKKLTYEEWLGNQSEKRQIAVLGKAKQKLWKDGSLTFAQLVDQRGNEISLKRLKETVLNE